MKTVSVLLRDLTKVEKGVMTTGIVLSHSKRQCIPFSEKKYVLDYKLCNEALQAVDNCKYLGAFIRYNL